MARPADALTLAASGVTAYFMASQAHEAIGHGVACAAIGGRITLATTQYLSCGGQFSLLRLELLRLSGPAANLIVGALCFLVFERLRPGWPRFSAWLAGTVNLITATGYLMVSAWAGIGDWGEFLSPLPGGVTARVAAGAVGLACSVAIARSAAARLWRVGAPEPFARLLRIPYLAGSLVATLTALWNRNGALYAGVAAAATFAATCWLVVEIPQRAAKSTPPNVDATAAMARDFAVVAFGGLCLLGFVLLGHGIGPDALP